MSLTKQSSKMDDLVSAGTGLSRRSFSNYRGDSFKERVLNTQLAQNLIGRDAPNDLIAKDEGLSRIGNLCDMGHIRTLNIAFNPQLKSLEGIDQLPQLRHLVAYSCDVSDLSSLKDVGKIESIMLQQNRISAFTDAFKSLTKLQELRLDRNRITRIENLRSCTSLRRLELSANRLEALDGVSGLQNLEELLVSNNCIKSLMPLRSLPSLRELDVSGNQLKNLDGLRQVPTLEYLNASHNSISQLQIAPPPQAKQQKGTAGRKPMSGASSASSSSSRSSKVAASSGSNKEAAFTALGALPDLSLTEVYLAGNRIRSVAGFEVYGHCVDTIDLSNNNISDVIELKVTLVQFKKLSELRIFGNPCCEDTAAMDVALHNIVAQCSELQAIDGMTVANGTFQRPTTEEGDDTRSKRAGKKSVPVNGLGVSTSIDEGDEEAASTDTFQRGFHTWEVGAEDGSQSLDRSSIMKQDSGNDSDDDKETEEKENDQSLGNHDQEDENAAPRPKLVPMLTEEQIQAKEDMFKSLLDQCKEVLSNTVFAFVDKQVEEELEENGVDPTAGIQEAAERARTALEEHRRQQLELKKQKPKARNVQDGGETNNVDEKLDDEETQDASVRSSSTTRTAPLRRVSLGSGSGKQGAANSSAISASWGRSNSGADEQQNVWNTGDNSWHDSISSAATAAVNHTAADSSRNTLVNRVRQAVGEGDIDDKTASASTASNAFAAALGNGGAALTPIAEAADGELDNFSSIASNEQTLASPEESSNKQTSAKTTLHRTERQAATDAALAAAHAQLSSGLTRHGSRVSSSTKLTTRTVDGHSLLSSSEKLLPRNGINADSSTTDDALLDTALLTAKITKANKYSYAADLPSADTEIRGHVEQQSTVLPVATGPSATLATIVPAVEADITKEADSNDGFGRLRDFDRFEKAMFSYGGTAGYDPRSVLSYNERKASAAPPSRRSSVPSAFNHSNSASAAMLDSAAAAGVAIGLSSAKSNKPSGIVRSNSMPRQELFDTDITSATEDADGAGRSDTQSISTTYSSATGITSKGIAGIDPNNAVHYEDDADRHVRIMMTRPSPSVPPPPSPSTSSVVNLHEFVQLSAPKLQALRPPPVMPLTVSMAVADDSRLPTLAVSPPNIEAPLPESGSLSADGTDARIKSKLIFNIPESARAAINAQRKDKDTASMSEGRPSESEASRDSSNDQKNVHRPRSGGTAVGTGAKVNGFGGMINIQRLEGDELEAAVLRATTPHRDAPSFSPRSRGQTPASARDAGFAVGNRFSPRP